MAIRYINEIDNMHGKRYSSGSISTSPSMKTRT